MFAVIHIELAVSWEACAPEINRGENTRRKRWLDIVLSDLNFVPPGDPAYNFDTAAYSAADMRLGQAWDNLFLEMVEQLQQEIARVHESLWHAERNCV